MAQNFKQRGAILSFIASLITCPAGNNLPTAGDPVLVGAAIVGVSEVTASAVTDVLPVNTIGVYNLSVVGKTNAGANSAVAIGDKLYISAAAVVNKDTTGVYFGTALGTVVAGATSLIDVRLAGSF